MAVIQYIKSFSDRWQKEKVKQPISLPAEPSISAESLEHGHKVFSANCVVCHGKQGHGDGVAAATLTDAWGNPEHPANYTLPPGSQGGVKLGHDSPHLFKTVHNGIGGTAMPPFAGSLSAKDIWDVVHFIQSLRIDAQMQALKSRGLSDDKSAEARQKLWQDLSPAAEQGMLDTVVVHPGDSDSGAKQSNGRDRAEAGKGGQG